MDTVLFRNNSGINECPGMNFQKVQLNCKTATTEEEDLGTKVCTSAIKRALTPQAINQIISIVFSRRALNIPPKL